MEKTAQEEVARVQRRRFDVEEYHLMAEAGILHEDDRVELIEGDIVEMNPIGSRHAACVRELTWLLSGRLGEELRLDVQNPVRLDGGLEPQPDLAVLRAGDYRETLPGPGDVLLIIEVADTSLAYDREVKLPLYARSGIPEVWLVDLQSGVVEVHSGATPEGYRTIEKARRKEEVPSRIEPGLVLRVDEVIGPLGSSVDERRGHSKRTTGSP
jgi:Uma2 family endonuclease